MIQFIDFCQGYGILLDSLPPVGEWVRVKTADKPRHRNGAVKFMGDFGFAQNWATMEEPAYWRGEVSAPARMRLAAQRQDVDKKIALQAATAAQKAKDILGQCELAAHPYFERKGFPEHLVNVSEGVAVIPMRIGREIVGCQMITAEGDKRFLFGQKSGGAEYIIGQNGLHILCEGYATALSAQAVMRNLKAPYTIHATFSAGNMKRIASGLRGGIVLADNDASGTGERVAKEIGWPYWMSDVVGEDFNDAHQRLGTFQLAMMLRGILKRR